MGFPRKRTLRPGVLLGVEMEGTSLALSLFALNEVYEEEGTQFGKQHEALLSPFTFGFMSEEEVESSES